ncbi:hypothetical protein LCGC14_2250180 [marine sediment metagenome]|uniref:Uncharacterized protein n=1 Tax=marine sediment metagenome TaxID=412755 RepID=A0A0F9FFC4_9ZZZZ
MKFRKNKSEKNIISKGVNKSEEAVNAWDVINENFTNISLACKTLEKSIQNLSANTNLMKENLKSQANTSKRIINDTVAKLRETKNNTKKAKITTTSLKRTIYVVSDNSKKAPGFPLELLN